MVLLPHPWIKENISNTVNDQEAGCRNLVLPCNLQHSTLVYPLSLFTAPYKLKVSVRRHLIMTQKVKVLTTHSRPLQPFLGLLF